MKWLILIALLLPCSVTLCAENLDEMDARLEQDRVKIEAERKTFNEECKQVRHEDAAAVKACSNRKEIILFEMYRWKFEVARAHDLRCKSLAADIEKWKMGVTRAEDVMKKNAVMGNQAADDRVEDAAEAAKATAKFATSYYLDKISESLIQANATKKGIEQVLAKGPEYIRRAYPGATAAQVVAAQKTLTKAAEVTNSLIVTATEAKLKLEHATPQEKHRLLENVRDWGSLMRNLAEHSDDFEAVGGALSALVPNAKFLFEAGVTLSSDIAAYGDFCVNTKLQNTVDKNQAIMQKALDDAKRHIAEDQLKMQTLGCSGETAKQ